jgi:hypothetical protein
MIHLSWIGISVLSIAGLRADLPPRRSGIDLSVGATHSRAPQLESITDSGP